MNILLNFDLKSSKKLIFLLPEIYGVGFSLSKQICKYLGYNYNTSVQDLSVNDLKKLTRLLL